jgi:hypothetical protein
LVYGQNLDNKQQIIDCSATNDGETLKGSNINNPG